MEADTGNQPSEIDQVKALSDALAYYGWEVSVGHMEDGYIEVMAIDRRDTRSVRYVKYSDEEYTLFRAVYYLAKACGVMEPEKLMVGAGRGCDAIARPTLCKIYTGVRPCLHRLVQYQIVSMTPDHPHANNYLNRKPFSGDSHERRRIQRQLQSASRWNPQPPRTNLFAESAGCPVCDG